MEAEGGSGGETRRRSQCALLGEGGRDCNVDSIETERGTTVWCGWVRPAVQNKCEAMLPHPRNLPLISFGHQSILNYTHDSFQTLPLR